MAPCEVTLAGGSNVETVMVSSYLLLLSVFWFIALVLIVSVKLNKGKDDTAVSTWLSRHAVLPGITLLLSYVLAALKI